MGQPLVELVDIRKRYGTGEAAFEALRGVSSVSYTHLTLPTT